MAKEATLEKEPKAGNPQDNPDPNPTQQPDPAAELVEIRRKLEELNKQVSDKDSYISNLQSEKETLETRLSQVNRPAQIVTPSDTEVQSNAARILEKAQIDPEGASKELANLIQNVTDTAQKRTLEQFQQRIQPAIENNIYAAEVKSKHADLVDFFGERALTVEVSALMEKGKPFKEAVDAVVKQYRQKYDSLKSNATVPPPRGAQGEEGGNQPPPTPPPPKEMTQEDETALRLKRRREQGLV